MESDMYYRQLVLSTNWNTLSYSTHWSKASTCAVFSDKSASFLLMNLIKCYYPKHIKLNEYAFLLNLLVLIMNSHKSCKLSKTLCLDVLLVFSLLSRPESSMLFYSFKEQYWESLCSFFTQFIQDDEKLMYARFLLNIAYVNKLDRSKELKKISDIYCKYGKDVVDAAINAITVRLNQKVKEMNKSNKGKKNYLNRHISPDYKSIAYRKKYSDLLKSREKMKTTQYTCLPSSGGTSNQKSSVAATKKNQLKTQCTDIREKMRNRKFRSKSFYDDAMFHILPGCYGCGKKK